MTKRPAKAATPSHALMILDRPTAISADRLYVPPTLSQASRMRPVLEADVQQAIANKAMPTIPREDEAVFIGDDADKASDLLLNTLFPSVFAAYPGLSPESTDDDIKRVAADMRSQYNSLGMERQASSVAIPLESYIAVRRALTLAKAEGILRASTLVPIKYLPDLFMACPVWFWHARCSGYGPRSKKGVVGSVLPHHVTNFCELFGRRWSDTFLLFNYRSRDLANYVGDHIPPTIMNRMLQAGAIFDYVVVMTPYLDLVRGQWDDSGWLRSLDPYVVGFQEGVPMMTILGRFSDAGVFPLHAELLAGTMEFVRNNMAKLRHNTVAFEQEWYPNSVLHLGTKLNKHCKDMIAAYEAGTLFSWLRSEADLSAAG